MRASDDASARFSDTVKKAASNAAVMSGTRPDQKTGASGFNRFPDVLVRAEHGNSQHMRLFLKETRIKDAANFEAIFLTNQFRENSSVAAASQQNAFLKSGHGL